MRSFVPAFISLVLALSAQASPLANSLRGEATDEAAITKQLRQKRSCCSVIDYFLPDKVFYPQESRYNSSLSTYWTKQEGEITPSCIVSPDSAQDVAISVLTFNVGDFLRLNDCSFAVRGGGHTPWGGAANIDEGVTIDLARLNQVKISSDKKTAGIGAGNRWGNIYAQLDAAGLSMVGGRVSSVGVGGLVLGGGISFFSGRKGFACDSVNNFEVVLANGNIVNANPGSYKDLYKALKGGSNNFGVVTRMDVSIFEQGNLWGGFLIQNFADLDAQLAFVENFTKSENFDENAALLNNYAFSQAGAPWQPAQTVMYTKAVENPPVFQKFISLPQLLNTLKFAPLSVMTAELDSSSLVVNQTGRSLFITSSFKNSAAYAKSFMGLADEWKNSVAGVAGIRGAVTFQPLSAKSTRIGGTRNGGNVLGLDNAPDLQIVSINVAWNLESDDGKLESSLKDLFRKAEEKARSINVYHPYTYLNYAPPWSDPITGYGQQNVEFLKKVSKDVDPRGVFQRQCPGGFKLFD